MVGNHMKTIAAGVIAVAMLGVPAIVSSPRFSGPWTTTSFGGRRMRPRSASRDGTAAHQRENAGRPRAARRTRRVESSTTKTAA